jgi:AcrR family transcriptional regulator
MSSVARPKSGGRPREFDREVALERALNVFWAQGFEGTSLSDLTEAMGINRPSLYAAFGNKEALFREALDRYSDVYLGFVRAALEEPRARAAIASVLRGYAASVTNPRTPPGCLTVQGALAGGPGAASIRAELAARRAAGEEMLTARLQRARKEGDLAPGADPHDLARYVNAVAQGLAVQAAGGASRKQLDRVVDIALRAWPD